MSAAPDSSVPIPGTQAQFTETHWSLIVKAGGANSTEARESLNQLCGSYWYPLYAFVRRQGQDSHAAKDSTQAFFVHLLEKDFLKKVERDKGRFRSFLLAVEGTTKHTKHTKTQAESRCPTDVDHHTKR